MTLNVTFGNRAESTGNPVVDFSTLAPAAGDKLYIIAQSKPATALVSSITGFTKVGDHASTTGVGAGNDVGDTCIEIWEKTAVGGETTVTITGNASNSFTHGWPIVVTATNGIASATYMEAADNSSGNNVFQGTFGSQTYDVGDRLIWAGGMPTDATTGGTNSTPSGFSAPTSLGLTSGATSLGQDGAICGGCLTKTGSSATQTVVVGPTGITGTTNTYGPFVGILIKEAIPPAITQAAYRWYADGTEAGSTALAAQDTAYSADLTSGDVNLQVRVRLQSTNATDLPATDDWALQWEKNTSGSWADVVGDLVDSYDESNASANLGVGDPADRTKAAQSFTGNGKVLSRAGFYAARGTSAVPADFVAVLYAHSGTYGATGSVPTGTALATSTSRNSSSFSTLFPAFTWEFFNFDGTFTLVNGTRYFISFESVTPGTGTYATLKYDSTSPTHDGVYAVYVGGWTSTSTADVIFDVRSPSGTTAVGYASALLDNTAPSTNRLGAGTGSFTAGDVTEDGVANDQGWPGNNYTEHLYSITLKQADLANADTLRFRVLRNGATTGMTYTATPTIDITIGSGTAHTATPTDNEGLTDSVVITMSQAVPKTDNLGLTDATTQVHTALLLPTDSEGLTDTAVRALAMPVTATDNLGLTDAAPQVNLGKEVAQVDAEGLTDSTVRGQGHAQLPTDSEGLTDTPLVVHTALTLVTDSEGLTDAATRAQGHTVLPTDSEGLTDSTTRQQTMGAVILEANGLTDTAVVVQGEVAQSTDTMGLSDTPDVVLTTSGEFTTDNMGLTDAAVRVLSMPVSTTDNHWLTDTVVIALGHAKSQVDSLGLSDTPTINASMAPPLVIDALGVTDSTVLNSSQALAFTDNLGLSDAAVRSLGIVVAPTDTCGLTDSTLRSLGAGWNPIDSEGLTDLVQAVSVWIRTLTDNLGLSDTPVVSLTGTGSLDLTDNEGLTDALTSAVGYVLPLSDTVTASDAALVGQGLGRSTSDLVGATDSAVVSLGSAPTLIDSEGLTDLVAVAHGDSLAALDALGLTDSVVADLIAAGSQFEHDNLVLTDSVVVVLASGSPGAKDADATLGPGFGVAGDSGPGGQAGMGNPGYGKGSLGPGGGQATGRWQQ